MQKYVTVFVKEFKEFEEETLVVNAITQFLDGEEPMRSPVDHRGFVGISKLF